MIRYIFLFGTLVTAATLAMPVHAQHFIAGQPVYCTAFNGAPVALISNPGLSDVGRAYLAPTGQPVMELNPNVINSLQPVMQLFWYGHECAHHVLGHTMGFHPMNEAAADCWAVRTGRNQGWFPPAAFNGLVAMLGSSSGSVWGHLPGPARINNMWACYNS